MGNIFRPVKSKHLTRILYTDVFIDEHGELWNKPINWGVLICCGILSWICIIALVVVILRMVQ